MKNNTFFINKNTWIILIAISFAAIFTACDIDDYDMSKLGRFEGLSIETEKKIISDYQKLHPYYKLRDIFIRAYYGTYNGVVFVGMAVNVKVDHIGRYPYKDICIYGITIIKYNDYDTLLWYNSQFYKLGYFYNKFNCFELISPDDIKIIAGYFGGWVECTHEHNMQ